MIRLLFTYNKEIIFFDVNNKTIRYMDRKWPMGINFIPKDHDFVRKVILSRNRLSHEMIKWIDDANSGKNLAEWETCKDDYEVAEIIKRDAKLKGCVFQQMFTEKEIAQQKVENKAVLRFLEKKEALEQTQEPVVEEQQVEEQSPENASAEEGEPQ